MRRAIVALTLLLALLLPAHAAAQSGSTVTGKVANGTAGASLPEGMEVELHIIKGQSDVDSRTAPVEADGTFQFTDVPTNLAWVYLLVAEYGGVFYSAQFDPSQEQGPVRLTVFEPTSSDEVLRLRNSVALVAEADPRTHLLTFLEIHTLENASDRTFVPDLEGVGMPSLVRFPLPPDARDLDVQTPLPGGQFLQVDQGFAIVIPVPPGQHEIMFSYRVPYTGNELAYERSFPFQTSTFRLLVNDNLGTASVEGLRQGASTTIGGRSHSVFEGEDLARGASVTINLAGLPQPSLAQRLSTTLSGNAAMTSIGVVAAIALAGLLVLAIVRGRRHRPLVVGAPSGAPIAADAEADDAGATAPEREPAGPAGADAPAAGAHPSAREAQAALVAAIAELDDRFDRGEVARDAYEAERAALKARLMELRVQQRHEQ